jgi:Rrf2 family protein
MPLFSAKLDYALRAAIDLAMQPPGEACQSREIAARQNITGPYLDQILAVLKREGIVRSIRGAGGGYTLAQGAHKVTAGDVVRAIVGDPLLRNAQSGQLDPNERGSAYIVRKLADRCEEQLSSVLDSTTLADLVADKQRMDDTLSYMAGI